MTKEEIAQILGNYKLGDKHLDEFLFQEDIWGLAEAVQSMIIKARIDEIKKCFPCDNEKNNHRIEELTKELGGE